MKVRAILMLGIAGWVAVEFGGLYGAIAVIVLLVSELRRKEVRAQEMEHLAFHDALTGLPNRRLFDRRMRDALRVADECRDVAALMFIDLDRFKNVNDCLGHDIGDLLLHTIADRLSGCVRRGDTVSRQGGDEFMILLEGVREKQEVVQVADRIHAALNEPMLLAGHELLVTMSMGIALYPQDGGSTDELIKHADTAMYAAKEKGKNNYQLFAPHMNDRMSYKMRMESALRKALDRREFLLQYQPQVQMDTGQIIGMEALIRWQSSEFGLVSPSVFIPLAEETGLIVSIGEWALRAACEQNKRWQDTGYAPMKIAVNLSARQFVQDTLVETVARVLCETGLAPHYLDLEITESIAMQDADYVLAKLTALRELGVQISIDDFGTGYSSLSYIKKFPINTLKIAQPFVTDITESPDDAAIVTAIIAMAHGLKLNVIAEGVETDYQRAFLRKLRCDEMQGFLFSKPLSPESLTPLLTEAVAMVH